MIPGIAGTESEGTSFRSVPERDILFQERLSHNATKAAALYVKGKSEVRGGLWAITAHHFSCLPGRDLLQAGRLAWPAITRRNVPAGCDDARHGRPTEERPLQHNGKCARSCR